MSNQVQYIEVPDLCRFLGITRTSILARVNVGTLPDPEMKNGINRKSAWDMNGPIRAVLEDRIQELRADADLLEVFLKYSGGAE